MTVDHIVREMRRRLGEALASLGEAEPVYLDVLLLEYVMGAAQYLHAMGISDDEYVVNSMGMTITPEPSSIDGLLLASLAGVYLIRGEIVAKIRDGELGVRFKTGMEEISTTEATKRVTESADELEEWYNKIKTLKLSKRSDNSSFRVQ